MAERKWGSAAAVAFVLAVATGGQLTWVTPAYGQSGAQQRVRQQLGQAQQAQQRGPAQDESQPGQSVPDDDLKQINSAKSVAELMDLGKTFAVSQKREAAMMVIDKLLARDPKLLEDAQKQTPKAWNDLWFAQRAKVREKKLSPKDAAGRVKLAVWLHDAGLTADARTLLTAALAIDRNEPTAKELAEKWSIYSGGPIRFDLTMGLTESLVVPTVQDEGQAISPRAKDHVYLIVPIAYNPGGQRLMINKGDLKATGGDGKVCPVVGIALLERSESSSQTSNTDLQLPDRGPVPTLRMPTTSNEPLWEQIAVQPAERDKPPELSVMNTLHPIVRPAPGQAPQPPVRPTGSPKETRPGSGYAAFIVDVPESLTTLKCSYKNDAQLEVDLEFLKALGKQLENLKPADRDRVAQTMAGQVKSKSAPVASAALRKLSGLRLAGEKSQAPGNQMSLKDSPALKAMETAMVAAFANESPQVRRDAFNLLSRQDSEGLSARVSEVADPAGATNLVAEVRQYLADLREAMSAAQAGQENAQAPAPPNPSDQVSVTGLPLLPLAPGVPSLVLGCLKNKQAEVGKQTLEICLANPFDQLISPLKSADDAAVNELLTRVPTMEDAKVKAAVLRMLMSRSDRKLLGEILAKFVDTPVKIEQDTDPILEAAMRNEPVAVQRLLLELLAKADLSTVSSSEKLKKLIEKYSAAEAKPDKALQAAMVKLAMAQMKAGYEAPVKRSMQGGSRQNTADFDQLLASVAAGLNSDPQAARQAALSLLSLGRAQALNERLQRLQGEARDKRVQDLIQNLARDKSLWGREALPAFLAVQLASTELRTRQLAVSALSAIQSGADPKQRWRTNLAIKQVVEAKQLVTLTMDPDEKVSRPALSLLKNLATMTTAEASEFETAGDENGRLVQLGTVEQTRASKAVGTFACMVYVDLRPSSTQPGKAPAIPERNSVPLSSVQLTFQRPAQGGQVRVIADGVQIGPPEANQPGQSSASPGSIPIDAGLLLRKAMESPEAEKEGLAGKINTAALRAALNCELKYEQLGAWGAEVTVQETADANASEFPLKVVSAKIVIEPSTQ